MIHLSFLLLSLQYCCLFISIIISFHSSNIHYLIMFISSLPRFSLVNVVLVFNDSLIIIAPSSPILVHVHINYHFIFILCIYIILFIFISFLSISLLLRFSSVNVVLVFNNSLIILATSSPIMLTVHINDHFILLFVYTLSYYIHFISFNFITTQNQHSQRSISFQ